MAVIGWALQRFLLERSARGGALLPILTTFGLAIVIDNVLFEQSAPTHARWRLSSAACPTIPGMAGQHLCRQARRDHLHHRRRPSGRTAAFPDAHRHRSFDPRDLGRP